MKILHLNAGNETGGGMHHILNLLNQFNRDEFILGVLEKGELLKRANEIGIRTVYFPNKTRMSIPLMYQLQKYIRKEKITVIHTHGPRANVYANFLKRICSFHWIVTVHSDPWHDFRGKGLRGEAFTRLHVHAIRNADKIISVSNTYEEKLTTAGVHGEKMTTAWNGIDFKEEIGEEFYTEDNINKNDDTFIFLKVARLEPVKGHQIALEAFSEIIKEKGNCQFILIGDGPLRTELQASAKSLGIAEHVHFLGHLQDPTPYYHLANVKVLSSFSEGFPLVLLEAARSRTPVIATDVGGVGELVPHQALGWRIKPGDVNELVQAMKEALIFHQNGWLETVGEKFHQHAASRFSLEKFAQSVYNVYLSVKETN
ncbi:glycosyltransferase [Virgibacillus sp. W0181]|uniref:glycosyltransferase n=1 Tax=Virgibacillus sp. W0181 TaxID=3391581 RepID=UPI003F465DA9